MKRNILLMALAMTVVLTACGGNAGKAAGGNTDSDVSEEAAATGKYARGTVTETGWESAYFGLRFTAPEGMSMIPDEQIIEMMGIARDSISGDFNEHQLEFAELNSVTEMMSGVDGGIACVIVAADKLLAGMDASQYVEVIEQSVAQVSNINYTLVSDDEIVKIGNEDYIKITYLVEAAGASVYQDNYIRVVGERAITLALTYNDEGVRDDILNAFTAF